MRRLGALGRGGPVVAVQPEAGHNVVRRQRGSDEGRRLDSLHVHLLVLVPFFRDLADDVEVLSLATELEF